MQQQRRRRSLTPEQKKKLRRKRWLKKNLKFFVLLGLLAIVAIVLLCIGGGRKADKTAAANSAADPSAVNEQTQTGESAEEGSIEAAEETTDTSEPIDETGPGTEETDIDPVTESAESTKPAAATAEMKNYGGSFVFDIAYIDAVNGAVTGPAITPNYEGIDPDYRDRWPDTKAGWMPLLSQAANTSDKTVCITVDDCYQGNNLQQIVQCAVDNNCRLTIFPIGENLELTTVANAIRFAWQNGIEIENHTYTHCGLYHFSDERMCTEIWQQNLRLNQVLGVDYTEHFFRPYGGDERHCQRMHACINQYGFRGIAYWNFSGSSSSVSSLKESLAPGSIYLFHTTDKDTRTLLEFIPYCISQGYTPITMNEMFGLPANETAPLTTTMDTPVPALKAFEITPVIIEGKKSNKRSRCRAAAVVQQRLIDLGWLSGEADGEFGPESAKSTAFYQLASGVSPSGNASPELQVQMFSDDAPTGSEARKTELLAEYNQNKN